MKIALTDPVWTRLYGPCGVQNVAPILGQLAAQWDPDIAKVLFWEKLHHQETLYPATYAALPWLFDIAQNTPDAAVDCGEFFSHVLTCAPDPLVSVHDIFCDNAVETGLYNGLPTTLEPHHHDWLAPDERLQADDCATLKRVEQWFTQTRQALANFAIEVFQEADTSRNIYLLRGYASLAGVLHLSQSIEAAAGAKSWVYCPACGQGDYLAKWGPETINFIRNEDPFTAISEVRKPDHRQRAVEWRVSRDLAEILRFRHPDVSRFLLFYANWSCCHSGQGGRGKGT